MLMFVAASIIKSSTTEVGSEQMGLLQSFFQVGVTDVTGSTPNIVTIFTGIRDGMLGFIKLLFLYDPSVWAGGWIWVWVFVCLPLGIGMMLSLIFIIRGVGSG
jgi:hypothetical protein